MNPRYVKSLSIGMTVHVMSAMTVIRRRMTFGPLLLASFLLASCGGGGGSAGTPPPVTTPPSDLQYPAAPTFVVDTAITALTPTVVGEVTSYSVSPALPAGLSLNTTSGVISGTPTGVAGNASYTVNATNAGGSTTATVSIVVMAAAPAAPSDLKYRNPPEFVINTAITPLTPTVTGTVTSYSVSPALPEGLSLDTNSGVISGTPTIAAAEAKYIVKASNGSGSTTAIVSIVVVTASTGAPSGLNYPAPPAFVVNTKITPLTPTVVGTVTSYSVTPALPAGLSLSTTTGVIAGTPTTAAAKASYTVKASNSAGSTTAVVSIVVTVAATTPPSGLQYPTPPTLVVGTAITPLRPTVVGQVTSYSASPALPAGLSLNTTSGVISGTPTSVAAKANYAVNATNAGGSTMATVSIVVMAATPPLALTIAYPSPYYGFTVSVIAQITPSNAGGAVNWAISPALPAGLVFNTSNGTISGTPTVATAPGTYTITATNSTGQGKTSMTLAVAAAPVFNLGHTSQITFLRYANSSVMSLDQSGTWLLQAYSSGTILASGEAGCPQAGCSQYPPIDLAGNTAIDAVPAGVEVRSAVSGQVLATIAGKFSWFQLAADGSYITTAGTTGLTAWSTSGQAIATQTGDFSGASVFSAPGQIQVALGPAGQNVIQTIFVPSGTSTVSPAFQGTFNTWFVDGAGFLSVLQNTIWVYSSAAVEQNALVFTANKMGGEGHFFWIIADGWIQICQVGSGSVVFAASVAGAEIIPSGTTLGMVYESEYTQNTNQLAMIDLSGPTPTLSTAYSAPIGDLSAYAATSATSWVVGNEQGVIFDGASLAGPPRYLTPGETTSIAAGTQYFAVATASGQIFYFDAGTDALLGTINFGRSTLAMSSDGTVLAAVLIPTDPSYTGAAGLPVYALPSGTLLYNAGDGIAVPIPLSFSSSGTGLAVPSTGCPSGAITVATRIMCFGGWISPNGSVVAVNSGPASYGTTTDIYTNAILTTALPGWAVGWLDNTRLLVEQFSVIPPPPSLPGGQPTVVYDGASIFSPSGTNLGSSPIPQIQSPQVLTSDSIYSPQTNTITSVTSGLTLWASADAFCLPSLNYTPCNAAGAASGSQVIFAPGNLVLAQPY